MTEVPTMVAGMSAGATDVKGADEDGTPAQRVQGRREQWRAMLSVLVAGGVIGVMELASMIVGPQVPRPAAFLLAAVAFAALYSGPWPAGVSIAIVTVYKWIDYSDPGVFFHYTPQNLTRALAFTLAGPGVATVITLIRRQLERTVRDRSAGNERRRLHALIEQVPIGLVMFDCNRKVTMSNQRVQQVLGHPPQDLGYLGANRIYHTDSTQYTVDEQPLFRALKGEAVRDEDVFYARGDGKLVALRMSASSLRDSAGGIIGAVLTADDISEQKQAEQSYQEMAAIVSASDDAIYTIRTDGVILTWNPGAERLFGYTIQEVRCRMMTINMLVPSERLAELGDLLAEVRSGGHPRPLHTVQIRKEGTRIPVSTRFSPLYDKRGNVAAASVISRPLRALYEDDLEQLAVGLEQEGFDVRPAFFSGQNGLQVGLKDGTDGRTFFLPLAELNRPSNRLLFEERRFADMRWPRPAGRAATPGHRAAEGSLVSVECPPAKAPFLVDPVRGQ